MKLMVVTAKAEILETHKIEVYSLLQSSDRLSAHIDFTPNGKLCCEPETNLIVTVVSED